MALTRTTLSTACGQTDTTIVVASATGAAAGSFVLIDQEVMKIIQSYVSGTTIGVVRGQDGSAQVAHKVSTAAVFFLASDEAGPSAQTAVQFPSGARPRVIVSYSATGALTLPTPGSDMLALLNGNALLAMTLANPTVDMDGCILIVCGTGAVRAHTVTYTAGFGNVGGTADVITMSATQVQSFQCIAAGGFWQLLGPSATATASVSGPAIA